MVERDEQVGQLLKQFDDLGVADNTIVLYTTDNGVHLSVAGCWYDPVPWREEHQLGRRFPRPGSRALAAAHQGWHHLQYGHVAPGLGANPDGCRGVPDAKKQLLKSYQGGSKQYKVHLDDYNFLRYLQDKDETGPRTDFYCFSDDGKLLGSRDGDWKLV